MTDLAVMMVGATAAEIMEIARSASRLVSISSVMVRTLPTISLLSRCATAARILAVAAFGGCHVRR